MKVILKDFNYKGNHFDEVQFEWPNVSNIEEIPEGKAEEYISESLNTFLEN